MKKYRHCKTGFIADEIPYNTAYAVQGAVYHKDIIENSNDWKEITDCPHNATNTCNSIVKCTKCGHILNEPKKDYEILSYYNPKCSLDEKPIAKLKSDGRYYYKISGREFSIHAEHIINPDWTIHSVKRLLDGVIFTIGDKVDNYVNVINSFEVRSYGIVAYCTPNVLDIKYLKHARKPLFITEDVKAATRRLESIEEQIKEIRCQLLKE